MIKKILLITLGFSIAAGGFWAGQAQDPAPQNPSTVRTDPPTVAAQSTPADLSGTYAGTFNCDAMGLTGDTTLTINGNEFTLADGRTGRLVTSTTRGYTAVALQLSPGGTTGTTTTGTAGAATMPQVISLRAKKSGNRLTLSPASGSQTKCSFVTRKIKTPGATGTEVSNPATPAESPAVPAQTPAPSPTPEPNPSPSPTSTPTPVPSPGEPMPSPTASPTPTPSPSPGPRK